MYKCYDVASEMMEGCRAQSAVASRDAFSLERSGRAEACSPGKLMPDGMLKVEFEGDSQAMGLKEQKHKSVKQLGKQRRLSAQIQIRVAEIKRAKLGW